MARPTKQGVDYFPFDVHLDDKVKFVEIKYKLEGFSIVVKLLQRIYAQGYWCKWSDDEALLFSDEIRAPFDLVQNVVGECVEREFFSKYLFEKYSILTSKGIQKRYKEIVRRRKDVDITTEYLLIEGNFGVNDVNNSDNDNIKTELVLHDDGKSTQSKLNKTKSNNTNNYSVEFESFWSEYPRKLDKKGAYEKFKQAIKRHDPEIVIQGAKAYAKECELKGTEKQYIKHPKTFLHNDSFLNEFETKVNIGSHNKQNRFEPNPVWKKNESKTMQERKKRLLEVENYDDSDIFL